MADPMGANVPANLSKEMNAAARSSGRLSQNLAMANRSAASMSKGISARTVGNLGRMFGVAGIGVGIAAELASSIYEACKAQSLFDKQVRQSVNTMGGSEAAAVDAMHAFDGMDKQANWVAGTSAKIWHRFKDEIVLTTDQADGALRTFRGLSNAMGPETALEAANAFVEMSKKLERGGKDAKVSIQEIEALLPNSTLLVKELRENYAKMPQGLMSADAALQLFGQTMKQNISPEAVAPKSSATEMLSTWTAIWTRGLGSLMESKPIGERMMEVTQGSFEQFAATLSGPVGTKLRASLAATRDAIDADETAFAESQRNYWNDVFAQSALASGAAGSLGIAPSMVPSNITEQGNVAGAKLRDAIQSRLSNIDYGFGPIANQMIPNTPSVQNTVVNQSNSIAPVVHIHTSEDDKDSGAKLGEEFAGSLNGSLTQIFGRVFQATGGKK